MWIPSGNRMRGPDSMTSIQAEKNRWGKGIVDVPHFVFFFILSYFDCEKRRKRSHIGSALFMLWQRQQQ